MENQTCPKTWLLESILATLFCCLPLGILGIVNASKVSANFATGNYEEAERRSLEAAKWVRYSVIIGIIGIIISVIVNLVIR